MTPGPDFLPQFLRYENVMSQPVPPFWFHMRQGKVECVNENTLRLTAPNLAEHFIHINRDEDGRFSADVSATVDGPPLVTSTETFASADEAWSAAFELYRMLVVV